MVITVVGCCARNASIRDIEEAQIWRSVDTSMDMCRVCERTKARIGA